MEALGRGREGGGEGADTVVFGTLNSVALQDSHQSEVLA